MRARRVNISPKLNSREKQDMVTKYRRFQSMKHFAKSFDSLVCPCYSPLDKRLLNVILSQAA